MTAPLTVLDALVAARCHHCDFGSGYRGMDSCGKCDGTGSVFRVGDRTFPNTKAGFHAAEDAAIADARAAPATPEAGTVPPMTEDMIDRNLAAAAFNLRNHLVGTKP